MKSIFTDKSITPTTADLKTALADTSEIWNAMQEFAIQSYPKAISAWHFSGEKYGWSYRISDKKRVLIYLLPRQGFFKAAFVFGQKATDQILDSDISDFIKNELRSAKVYAEGRGIRIDVNDASIINDLKKLLSIKIAN